MNNKLVKNNEEELRKLYDSAYNQTAETFAPTMSLPILKLVYKAQADSDNIIKDNKIFRTIDDQLVPVGSFYHSGLKKYFDNPEVVIIHYIKAKLPTFMDENEFKHNELVGGYMIEDNAPFMFFFKSMALSDWWDFCGKLADVSRKEHVGAYAFKARFVVGKKDSQDGKFKGIMIPQLELTGEKVEDIDTFKMLMEAKEKVQTGLADFVTFKKGEIIGESRDHSQESLPENKPLEITEGQEVDPDDLPL